MKLYHGTSARHLEAIRSRGLVPRGRGNRRSNWDHTIKSRAGHVYLTTAYPLYFAMCAAKDDEAGLVVEVDTECLLEGSMFPDEDFIAQAQEKTSREQHEKVKLLRRTAAVDLDRYQHAWSASLKYLGTCSHRGTIPATAITRIATLDFKKRPEVSVMCADPLIRIDNYRFCGWRYRGLVAWLFGDGPMPGVLPPGQDLPDFEPMRQQDEALAKVGARRDGICFLNR